MSHISKIELEVNDIPTLKAACQRLGLEFRPGQKSFKWWGRECKPSDHAIRIHGADYEVGVVKIGRAFELQCDWYDANLAKALGPNGGLLKQAYAVERTKVEALRKGYRVIEKQTETGIRLYVRM